MQKILPRQENVLHSHCGTRKDGPFMLSGEYSGVINPIMDAGDLRTAEFPLMRISLRFPNKCLR